MDQLNVYSTHTFFLPFSWKEREGDRILSKLNGIKDSLWRRVSDVSDVSELYDEQQYYFQYVHPALYDTGKEDSLIFHLERSVPDNSSYRIYEAYDKNGIQLDINYVNINLYSGGVGVMSLYCTNRRYNNIEIIKTINDLGRRYIQAYKAENKNKIELNLGPKQLTQEYIADIPWKKSSFLEEFLNELNLGDLRVHQILDDRMYVMSAIFDSNLSKQIQSGTFHESQCWYELLFCDQEGWISCHNDDMSRELFRNANYLRWQKERGKCCGEQGPKYGTIYGISRYSFLCIAAHMKDKWFSGEIHKHMSTMYARMYEFAIFQVAAISVFSGKITEICEMMNRENSSQDLLEEISNLYRAYLKFENRQSFNEITNQDQGIEMYEIMQRQMGFSRKVAEIDEKIAELHNFATLISNKKSDERAEELNKRSHRLNIIVAIFVLPSLLAGAFSINTTETCQYWWRFASVFILLFVVGGLIWLLNSLKKRK